MTLRQPGIATVFLLGLLSAAGVPSASAQDTSAQPEPDQTASVEVSRLPVNLARIQRQLQQAAIREERDGLNLRYFVDVFAPAPPIRLFTPRDNLAWGPAPYGGPTHSEMLNIMTPKEFRTPAMDLSGLLRWLGDRKSND